MAHDTELSLSWRVLLFFSWPISWFDSWIWTYSFRFHGTPFLSWLRALWSASHLFSGFVLWWEFCLQVWSDNNAAIMLSRCLVKIGFMSLAFVESPKHSQRFVVEILPSRFHPSAQRCHLEAWWRVGVICMLTGCRCEQAHLSLSDANHLREDSSHLCFKHITSADSEFFNIRSVRKHPVADGCKVGKGRGEGSAVNRVELCLYILLLLQLSWKSSHSIFRQKSKNGKGRHHFAKHTTRICWNSLAGWEVLPSVRLHCIWGKDGGWWWVANPSISCLTTDRLTEVSLFQNPRDKKGFSFHSWLQLDRRVLDTLLTS